jgi:hypothetical protein
MPAVSVGNTATLIVAANANRLNLFVTNNGSTVCYVGKDSSVTTTNGIQLNQNDVMVEDNSGRRGYLGNIYGIVSSGSADIRYWERQQ